MPFPGTLVCLGTANTMLTVDFEEDVPPKQADHSFRSFLKWGFIHQSGGQHDHEEDRLRIRSIYHVIM